MFINTYFKIMFFIRWCQQIYNKINNENLLTEKSALSHTHSIGLQADEKELRASIMN